MQDSDGQTAGPREGRAEHLPSTEERGGGRPLGSHLRRGPGVGRPVGRCGVNVDGRGGRPARGNPGQGAPRGGKRLGGVASPSPSIPPVRPNSPVAPRHVTFASPAGVVRIWFLGRNRIRIHTDPSYLMTETPSAEIRIRISSSGTGYLSRLYSYPDTIIGSEHSPPSPTDSSIRAQEERHPAFMRVLNGCEYDLKSTLDFNAPTGAVEAVTRHLCKPGVNMDISLRNISMHYIRIHFGYAPGTHILNAL